MRSIVAALLALHVLPAAGAEWLSVPHADSLRFEGMQQGEPFRGRFGRFEAQIRFDPDELDSARFEVEIDMASADTRSGERDEVLLGSDFFAVRQFPTARFVTGAFEALGEDHFRAEAELTIRNRTLAIEFPFRWQTDAGGARIVAEVELDRIAFELGDSEDWRDADTLGHAVTVFVDLPLQRREKP